MKFEFRPDWEFIVAEQRQWMAYLSNELCVSEQSANRVWPGENVTVFTLLMTNGVKVTK